MGIKREVVPFRVRPDDWPRLQRVEQMIKARAEYAGWPKLSLHIRLQDSRGGGCEADSVAEARDSAVGRRSAVSALTMTFSAEGGGHDTAAARRVEVRLNRSGPPEVEIAGPDDIEVAGLARRIEGLARDAGRGGPRRHRWRSLIDWLFPHMRFMFITIASGIATTAIVVWLGLS